MKLLELFIDVAVRGNKAINGLKRVEGQAAKTERRMDGVGRSALAVVGNFAAMAGGAYAVGRAIGATVRAGANFEKQMNSVNAIAKGAGASADQLQGLNDKARQLGRETAFSATQSAGALEILLKNGVSVENILGGMADASLTLAAAMGEEIGTSADLLTDVMAQFGLEAKEAGDAIDIIAGASVASKFGMRDLWQSFSKAGAQAKSLGIDMSEYAAIVSMVSSNFKTGEEAGTGFRGFLTKLTGVSGPAKKRMKSLGLEFFKANGQLKELPDVLKELNDGLGDLSDEARTKAITEIFGIESMSFVNALLGKTGEELKEIQAAIAATSAEDLKNEKWKGLSAAVTEAKSALESLMITLSGSGLNEWLEKIVRGFTDIVRSIEKWINQNPETVQNIKDIIAAIAPWAAALAGVMITVGALRLAFSLFFKSTLARMTFFVGKMIAKIGLLVAELTGLTALMNSTTGRKNSGGRGGRRGAKGGGLKTGAKVAGMAAWRAATSLVSMPAQVAALAVTPTAAADGTMQAVEEKAAALGKSFDDFNKIMAQRIMQNEAFRHAAEVRLQNVKDMDRFLADEDNIMGSVFSGKEGGGNRPHSNVAPHMTSEQMRAAGERTVVTNITKTVGDTTVNVQVETEADPHQIAAVASEVVERKIQGAMLDTTN